MYTSFNINKQGMSATQEKIDLISNNIANSTTVGYKKLDAEFQTMLTETLDRPSYPNNSKDVYFGTGSKLGTTYRTLTQGNIQITDNQTDIALDGDGYFRVQTLEGNYAYTRNGQFTVDALGKLVDRNGNILDIQFEEGISYDNFGFSNIEFLISENGDINLKDGTLVGNISVYKATGDNGLLSCNDNLFVPKEGQVMIKSGDVNLIQGCVEMSNVNLVDEMKDLIVMQRAFQLNGKGISNADEMWSLINNMQSR